MKTMMLNKPLMYSLLWVAIWLCLLVGCGTSSKPPKSEALATNRSPKTRFINPKTTIDCHRREYTFKASRMDPESGRQCWQYVTSMSCWGRCDSGEIADWRFPFKKSFHPICIHEKKRTRRIRLAHCDLGAPDELRLYEFTEAVTCACQICSSAFSSCEGFPYVGTRAP